MASFTHIDEKGNLQMVDVTAKPPTQRQAVAGGTVRMKPETLEKIESGRMKKGNVLEAARIAGVMAAKRTAELIPLCHPLNLSYVGIEFELDREHCAIRIQSTARLAGPTGVEMEALAATAIAALTIYDMCKSADRDMTITDIRLLEKSGGKSGHYKRPPEVSISSEKFDKSE